jgi:hypothetical protein
MEAVKRLARLHFPDCTVERSAIEFRSRRDRLG